VIRSLEDVALAANISRKEAARNYRFLLKELNPSVPRINTSGYIGKISSSLNLSGDVEKLALNILREASELKLSNGRGPAGLAAACMYISGQLFGIRLTQGKLANIAQVTEVTIRNRYKEIAKNLEFNIKV
jgi:transcription initiation factor TFIIB